VWTSYGNRQKIAAKSRNPQNASSSLFSHYLRQAEAAREGFLELAREKLGVEGRSSGWRSLEESTPGEALPGPEAGTSKP
jgi:hypothetical protein